MTRRVVSLCATVAATAVLATSGAAGVVKRPAGPPVPPVPVGAVIGVYCIVTPDKWMRCRVPSSGRPATVLVRAWADGTATARVVAPRKVVRR